MTWKEHLAWCKERAIAELDRGDMGAAIASMIQDLPLHEQAPDASTIGFMATVGMNEAITGNARGVRKWIEGWN